VEGNDLVWDAEANGGLPSLSKEGVALRIGQVAAATVVMRRHLTRLLLLANCIQLLGGAVAVKGLARCQQAIGFGGVQTQALALAVGSMRTDILASRHLRALVPGDAQPMQVVDDVALELLRAARGIGVLDAQHVRTADVPGEEEVVEAGPRCADVQWPG